MRLAPWGLPGVVLCKFCLTLVWRFLSAPAQRETRTKYSMNSDDPFPVNPRALVGQRSSPHWACTPRGFLCNSRDYLNVFPAVPCSSLNIECRDGRVRSEM
ncbi:unnamed protein product [Discosporangium mesarthrocarpum]